MRKNRKSLFEFYYLTELTRQKVKPLSRFEEPLDEKSLTRLKQKGFSIEIIPRKTLLGTTVYETVFSTSSRYIDFYTKKFYNSSLKKTAANQKLEGFLFGYPSCCVNQFIKHPYTRNYLPKNQQGQLFHWACPHCKATPDLIPYYSAIHNDTEEWFIYQFPGKYFFNTIEHYQKKIQSVAAALLLFTGLAYSQSESDTTHYIPLLHDDNLNGITYAEEVYLGAYDHGLAETCRTYVLFYKTIIDSLPDTLQANKPYREDHPLRGIVVCPKCGLYVNMGYVKIINPLRKLELDIPYLGLHFMEFGHFSYGSDSASSRIDVDMLKKILFPFDHEHMLPTDGDTDGDGLTDGEEDSLSMNYAIDIDDYDGDGVPDGAQHAEGLIRLFPHLKETVDNIHSQVKFFPVWGVENCQVCGSLHNMGLVEITNPENKKTLQIPYIALHSLANGCFAYSGTVHQQGRVNAVELTRAMKTHTVFTSNDLDDDGLKDAEEIHFNLDINNVDSDNNGITDTRELALRFVDSIKALPTEPRTNGPYIEYMDMDGVHLCSVCGKEVVMGIMKIYNPLINTTDPFEISNYAFHFLENGSFEHEGLLHMAGSNRIDPILLSAYLNISITGIDKVLTNNTPQCFSLEQNYPNPFNSSTVIKYNLPVVGRDAISPYNVTLKVYDILGKEVAMLVNETKQAGSYEVQFDASQLASGVYFYKLTAGNYSSVKKLLLMK